MIGTTFGASGILLGLTGWLFQRGALTADTKTIAWTVIFFIASCAASAAYLTVSESFPLEIRAMAISVFTRAARSSAASAHPRCLVY